MLEGVPLNPVTAAAAPSASTASAATAVKQPQSPANNPNNGTQPRMQSPLAKLSVINAVQQQVPRSLQSPPAQTSAQMQLAPQISGSPNASPNNSQMSTSIPSHSSQNTSTSTGLKPRQTILRSEMESFLSMGCTSLIRKFLAMQGVDCTYSHYPVQALRISAWLTEGFLQSLNTQAHPAIPPAADDIFDFDSLVDLFKQYVYSRAADIRAKTQQSEPDAVKIGYRYDLAFHKSAHHVKMENNHALVEDLNLFAKLPADLTVPSTSFYGVFDGHGGYMVAEYLSLHMASAIARHPLFSTDKLDEVLRGCYQTVDSSILKKIYRDVRH